MISTEKTRARAQGVLDHIHQFPQYHGQSFWYMVQRNLHVENVDIDADANICNTSMCIGGTVMFLEHGKQGLVGFSNVATEDGAVSEAGELLGLDDQESKALFLNMDNEGAVQMVKCLVVGDEFGFRNLSQGTRYPLDVSA